VIGEVLVVGEAAEPRRPGEGSAHGDLPAASVGDGGDGIAPVAQCVPPFTTERALGGPVAFDERAHAVPPPPAVGALAAGVAAVDGASPGSEEVDDRAVTHRALVFVDDVVGGRPGWWCWWWW
jgi:hypothetical protein